MRSPSAPVLMGAFITSSAITIAILSIVLWNIVVTLWFPLAADIDNCGPIARECLEQADYNEYLWSGRMTVLLFLAICTSILSVGASLIQYFRSIKYTNPPRVSSGGR